MYSHIVDLSVYFSSCLCRFLYVYYINYSSTDINCGARHSHFVFGHRSSKAEPLGSLLRQATRPVGSLARSFGFCLDVGFCVIGA